MRLFAEAVEAFTATGAAAGVLSATFFGAAGVAAGFAATGAGAGAVSTTAGAGAGFVTDAGAGASTSAEAAAGTEFSEGAGALLPAVQAAAETPVTAVISVTSRRLGIRFIIAVCSW